MCFWHECEWSAMVHDTTEGTAKTAVRCGECRCWIYPGEWVKHVYQQENEDCQGFDCACGGDGDTDDCDFGETFDYDVCERCEKVLASIEALERERGCSPHESRPMLTEMSEALREEPEYAEYAAARHPELAAHLWRFDRTERQDFGDWHHRDLEPVDELGGGD